MIIYTIGYEGISLDTFMALLADQGIDTIVDVREMPLSRKPGFSKTALANVLNLSGLEYVHMVKLGCPRAVRDRYKADGDWNAYTRGFLSYLKTQQTAIAELSAMAASAECALLCYEADYNFCHRSMVANAVRDYCGAEIRHISAVSVKKGRTESLLEAFV
jgi:uncharacterized protein (DUF488 family)